jgi:hypothetical protein
LREKEPIACLARIRWCDGKTWFEINLVPDAPGVTIRIGDEVEVLEAVPPGGGPIRPRVLIRRGAPGAREPPPRHA